MRSLAGFCGFFCFGTLLLQAEIDTEIPLGIEAVTGLRTDYVHRGFQLAESALDFQVEAEITLSNETALHLGFAHLSESNGDFNETTSYAEFSHSFGKKFTGGVSLTYRDRNDSLLAGGFDFGFFSSYAINDDWRWLNQVNFDFGVEGTYVSSDLEWSHVLSETSFITVESGLSFVSDYLQRDGLNDFHTRLTYTYALSDQVSFTPFIGSSIQIDDRDTNDLFYGGVWFEVIF